MQYSRKWRLDCVLEVCICCIVNWLWMVTSFRSVYPRKLGSIVGFLLRTGVSATGLRRWGEKFPPLRFYAFSTSPPPYLHCISDTGQPADITLSSQLPCRTAPVLLTVAVQAVVYSLLCEWMRLRYQICGFLWNWPYCMQLYFLFLNGLSLLCIATDTDNCTSIETFSANQSLASEFDYRCTSFVVSLPRLSVAGSVCVHF